MKFAAFAVSDNAGLVCQRDTSSTLVMSSLVRIEGLSHKNLSQRERERTQAES